MRRLAVEKRIDILSTRKQDAIEARKECVKSFFVLDNGDDERRRARILQGVYVSFVNAVTAFGNAPS
jgi:hypothetical protein